MGLGQILRAAILLLLAAAVPPVAAQDAPAAERILQGVSPADLTALLKAVDLPIIAAGESPEGPVFASQAHGIRFELQGANCRPQAEGELRCLTLLFVAAFDVADGVTVRALADRYNRSHYYGRAFQAADGPLILDFVADVGAVSDAHLVALAEIWTGLALPEFRTALSGGPAQSSALPPAGPKTLAPKTLAAGARAEPRPALRLGRQAGEWSPGDPINPGPRP